MLSLWKDAWINDIVFSGVSMLFGAVILVSDPKTAESKRAGHKPIGIIFLVGGVLAALMAIYRKFLIG